MYMWIISGFFPSALLGSMDRKITLDRYYIILSPVWICKEGRKAHKSLLNLRYSRLSLSLILFMKPVTRSGCSWLIRSYSNIIVDWSSGGCSLVIHPRLYTTSLITHLSYKYSCCWLIKPHPSLVSHNPLIILRILLRFIILLCT